MEITTYLEKSMESEMSANVIDLCPVGALTSKPYVFEARPWELKKTETIDVVDAVGSNIRVDTYDWEVKRVLPRINEEINEEWISDKTRYACDGLKNQRLDTPLIKNNGNFEEVSWQDAYKKIVEKISKSSPDKIVGLTGDMTNMETMFVAKNFFQKILNSNYLDSRANHTYINFEDRNNYLFNSSIEGIEESDLILLIGTNPRYEATILNSRIRKTYLKNETEIFSLEDVGDLTYPYKVLDNDPKIINQLIKNEHELSNKIASAKKPIIILGQSILNSNNGAYIFEELKKYLTSINKINDNWNSLNILSTDASAVGSYDLGIFSSNDGSNKTLKKIEDSEAEIIFLLGQDNLKIKKNNEFVIYIGSHGDKGADMADLILPGAAYTEQDGYFTNLEGKLQKAYKASYPPGEAKEDWQIINELSSEIHGNSLFNNKDELLKSMQDHLSNENIKNFELSSHNLSDEKILVEDIDYYYSNTIARASKTMSECRYARTNLKKTGTEG
ncbi:molybdopterin-dependent oxidoreductase [Pelagibacterales bacterium SAG-MED17]|nr:molybdopterin-dependent oxidoreductase [Pelagibacterales bacterium SAG-MED17]